jgi:hypothetical protein
MQNMRTPTTLETRVAKVESDVAAIKIDVAVIKAQGATKADIAELRTELKSDIAALKTAIAESKSTMILWMVSVVFLGQILPSLLKFISQYIQP